MIGQNLEKNHFTLNKCKGNKLNQLNIFYIIVFNHYLNIIYLKNQYNKQKMNEKKQNYFLNITILH